MKMPMILYAKLILKKKKKRKNSPPLHTYTTGVLPVQGSELKLGSWAIGEHCLVFLQHCVFWATSNKRSDFFNTNRACQLCSLLIKHTLVPAHSSILYQEHCSNNKAGIDFWLTSSPHSHLCQHFYFFNWG